MSNMNTSITIENHISVQGLTTFIANSMVFYAMLPEVEEDILEEEGEGRDAPFLYKVCQQFFLKVTSLSFRCCFQEVYTNNRHIPYTIAQWVDVVSCMMFAGAKKSHNMRAVAKKTVVRGILLRQVDKTSI